eukprot:TRINITY_DN3696_c0_g4_i1.p1 TRINITY_DN3696_c0_g4~~TRINITY_DN3696_c0_g4_i1.p1  ORF type:complete len:908 (-),score=317.40 TRINITY_DN3696_c0_g4_i1:1487-4210(-)
MAALSPEEFQKIQLELLELKQFKYDAQEREKRFVKEVQQLHKEQTSLTSEVQRLKEKDGVGKRGAAAVLSLGKSLHVGSTANMVSEEVYQKLHKERDSLAREFRVAKAEHQTQQDALKQNAKSLFEANTKLEEELQLLRKKVAFEQHVKAAKVTTTADPAPKSTPSDWPAAAAVASRSPPPTPDSSLSYEKALNEEIKCLKKQIEDVKQHEKVTEESHKKAVGQLTQEMIVWESKLRMKQDDLDVTRAELEKLTKESQAKETSLQAKVEELQASNNINQKEAKETAAQQASLISKLTAKDSELSTLRDLSSKNKETVARLQQDLTKATKSLKKHEAELSDSTSQLSKVSADSATLRKRVAELEELYRLKTEQAITVNAGANRVQQDLEEEKRLMMQAQRACEETAAQLQAERERARAKDAEMAQLKEELTAGKRQVTEEKAKSAKLDKTVAALTKKLANTIEESRLAKTEISSTTNQFADTNKSLKEAQMAIADLKKELEAVHDLEEKKTRAEDLNEAMRQQVSTMMAANYELEKQVSTLKSTLNDLSLNEEVQRKNDKQLIRELKGDVLRLRQALSRMQEEDSAGGSNSNSGTAPSTTSPASVSARCKSPETPEVLHQDITVLGTRIGVMQEEKTVLEIRCKRLEGELVALRDDLKTWKSDVVEACVTHFKTGERSSFQMDIDRAQRAKKTGIMSTLFRGSSISQVPGLTEELVAKMQGVLEEVLLKNFQLHNDIASISNQVGQLLEENDQLKQLMHDNCPAVPLPNIQHAAAAVDRRVAQMGDQAPSERTASATVVVAQPEAAVDAHFEEIPLFDFAVATAEEPPAAGLKPAGTVAACHTVAEEQKPAKAETQQPVPEHTTEKQEENQEQAAVPPGQDALGLAVSDEPQPATTALLAEDGSEGTA